MPSQGGNQLLHPQLVEQLRLFGLSSHSPPDARDWGPLLRRLSESLARGERFQSELWSRLSDAPEDSVSAYAELVAYSRTLERQIAIDAAELRKLRQQLQLATDKTIQSAA